MNTPEGEATMATIQSMREHTKQVYSKIVEKGGELPADGRLNLQNLAPTIRTIKQGGGDGTLWGTLYTTAYPNGIVLNSKEDYDALSTNNKSTILINGESISIYTITKFSFGAACTYTPAYFLNSCTKLQELLCTDVLKTVGYRFAYLVTTFTGDIHLPNVENIDAQFLAGNQAFNGRVTLGDKLQKISENFIDGATNFDQPIVIPASVQSIRTPFMATCRNMTNVVTINTSIVPIGSSESLRATLATVVRDDPAYRQGIRIAGPGAAAWKAALPDSSTDPFRKLILVEDKNG